MNKPTLPQGTRDFNASTIYKRNYIFNTIRNAFQLYGFEPLETPAMENIDTLMGKYGEEGDKLIFKILNNGLDNPAKKTEVTEAFNKVLEGKLTKQITERALRYDLTIPFARYVAMNHGQLTFPFKRYQMQPVWRADRPQKGRYREFYQCDADIVGSTSLMNEVELAHLYAHVFKLLNLPVTIKLNNRKILAALAELCGGVEKLIDITVAIDKLDKIGIEKVKEELQQRHLTTSQIEIITKFLSIQGSNQEKIQALHSTIAHIPLGKQGIEELEYILIHQKNSNPLPLEIDVTLARGLNYYTGTIFEVKANSFAIGSIGGGGRYDNLTELFGVPNMPGVGISFGVDRIYDVLEGCNLFPPQISSGSMVLFFNLGQKESNRAFELLQSLREQEISGEIYHESTKLDKQFKYAERKGIPIVIIIGSKELEDATCTIKQLKSGRQDTIAQNELLNYLNELNTSL